MAGRDGEGVELDNLAGGCGFTALRQAWGRVRAARRPLRRRVGTGVTAPWSLNVFRMRPAVLSLTVQPLRRNKTTSLALPHIG